VVFGVPEQLSNFVPPGVIFVVAEADAPVSADADAEFGADVDADVDADSSAFFA